MLDFKKAFDLVPHSILLEKLHSQFTFSQRSCKIIESYLTNRFQCVKLGDDLSTKSLPDMDSMGKAKI